MENTNKKNVKLIDKFKMLFAIVVVFSIFGSIAARIGTHNYENIKIRYSEKNNINYKVYLKENDFFESEYLEMNKTYIASLIDRVDINFKYSFDLQEKMSGSYSYYIRGIISANKASGGTGNYWSKEYKLFEKKDNKYSNTNKIEIDENVSIDYQEYNEILNSFKNEYGLSMQGNLKVELVVENNISTEKVNRILLKESNLSLNIPLTSLTIEVPIQSNGSSNNGILINEKVYDDALIYRILELSSYLFFGISGLCIVYMAILEVKSESAYNKRLRKILKVYDGILVEVSTLPNFDKFDVIEVKSFEELIDAHSEIRKPINFNQKIDGVKFLLIDNGIAWVYSLRREIFEKRDKA